MAYNKIVIGGETKIDLTTDTVSADNLLKGYTAHDKTGATITGTYAYELPIASATTLGGIKVSEDFSIDSDGVLTYVGESLSTNKTYAEYDDTTLGNNILKSDTGVKKVIGSSTLTSVGNYFCYQATALTALSLPTLTSAGMYFCTGATALTNLSLPALTSVGSGFCSGAKSLTTLSLPALTKTNPNFCYNATALTNLSLPALTTVEGSLCTGAKSLTTLSLPALTTVEGSLCYGATSLTTLSLGSRENVLTISSTTATFNWSNITVDSLVELGTALVNGTGTIQFNATAWGRLSDTQKAIFTNKGYTVTTVT